MDGRRLQFPQALGPLLLQRCRGVTTRGDGWRMARSGAVETLADAGLRCCGKLSPAGPVTPLWRRVGVPSHATSVAFAYPDDDVSALDDHTRSRLEVVPEVDFVTLGGFVYFNEGGEAIASVSIASQNQWGENGGLDFEGPFSWPASRTGLLHQQGRFRTISIKQFRDRGARWFVWLKPGEDIGGGQQCPDGGFAYVWSDSSAHSTPSDCYFRVSAAHGQLSLPKQLERFELVEFNSKQGKGVVLRHNRLKYNRMTLLAVPAVEPLANEMQASAPGLFLRGELKFASFPDGTPNLMLNPSHINGYDVVLLCDYDVHNGGAGWLHNLSLIYEIPRYGARSLTVILPFYPVGTMERISVEGEIPTAASFARMLSATPMTTQGPTRFVFFDIHALQNRFYFSDRVMPHLTTAIPLLRREIERIERSGERVAVVFPDDGAKKRYGPLFSMQRDGKTIEAYPLVVCSKARGPGDARTLYIHEGKQAVSGRHCVIVDDLVQSGGTMIGCKDLLFECGAAHVTGFVTHGVFPRKSWRRFATANTPPGKQPWTSFIITNSIPGTAEQVRGVEPFRVLSLAPRVIDLLGGVTPARPQEQISETEIRPTPHASPIPAHRSAL
eukprot:TRINITY_DN6057_c0_g1_i2.p1 TRINITY_DN6057_c0_g1~~TRINITY_DN6057_c0_g1_i2.p1  ORF type:complete len:612 (+),score=154.15 TRINITY_DN6057_c0_g1_i2:68-1903(+)